MRYCCHVLGQVRGDCGRILGFQSKEVCKSSELNKLTELEILRELETMEAKSMTFQRGIKIL